MRTWLRYALLIILVINSIVLFSLFQSFQNKTYSIQIYTFNRQENFEIFQVPIYNQKKNISLIRLLEKGATNFEENVKENAKLPNILIKVLTTHKAVLLDRDILKNLTILQGSKKLFARYAEKFDLKVLPDTKIKKPPNKVISFGIRAGSFKKLDEVNFIFNYTLIYFTMS